MSRTRRFIVRAGCASISPASAASVASRDGWSAGGAVRSCLFGGWQGLAPRETPGTPFSSQGACVRHVVLGGDVVALPGAPGAAVIVSLDPIQDDSCLATFTLVGATPGVQYQVRVFTDDGIYISRILSLPANARATAQVKLEDGLASGTARVLGGPAIPLELPADSVCN
jgi:hypothetical protein